MTAAQRAQFLRERFRAKFPASSKSGLAAAIEKAKPKRVRYVVLPKPTGRGFVSLGPFQGRPAPKWVHAQDYREKPALSIGRRQGAPVLAKVAQKSTLVKLPRLNLREPWELAKVKP